MTMIPDNQLRAECFNVLVDHFGYLDTERFVVMMSRSPEDYTTWHQRHFGNGESVLSLIHISEPTRRNQSSRMPSSA